jgi:AraC-like DNA-binding protein
MLGKSFGGVLKDQTLFFDNEFGKGSLTKLNPQTGLWLRDWNFTTQQKICLYKLPATGIQKNFCLIYLFDPAIVSVKDDKRKISINSRRNNLFFSNDVSLSFCVLPKQPFSIIDLSFPLSWVLQEFEDATGFIRNSLDRFASNESILMVQSCSVEEYKALHELKVCLFRAENNPVFIRSRIYCLIGNFLNKLLNENKPKEPGCNLRTEQVLQIEQLFMKNLNNPPNIITIAKKLNMSVPSLLRQFKLMFGKGIHEYFIERKMELAKKIIMKRKLTIKKLSMMFGYKQSSPFIETFTRLHGFSPGNLKW